MNAPSPVVLQPPSILLMGPSGSGKTYSIATLLESNLEVFVVSTEPHGLETLLDVVAARNLPLSKLHFAYTSPTRPGVNQLADMAKLIANMDQKSLSDMRPANRADAGFIKLLTLFQNFIDDKDGKSYGPIESFGPDRAIVIDSLSGLSAMAMDLTIGDKVTANPGEWGIAMRTLDKFLLHCTSDLKCFFALTAHIEKEEDPITGAQQVMVSTLGKKLAPSIPKFFSEVILADTRVQAGDKKSFTWSTNTANHVLKNRALPISSTLEPSFAPIVEAYRKRLELIQGKGAA